MADPPNPFLYGIDEPHWLDQGLYRTRSKKQKKGYLQYAVTLIKGGCFKSLHLCQEWKHLLEPSLLVGKYIGSNQVGNLWK